MRVASMRIATASPKPACLRSSWLRVAKMEKTATMTIAAAVTISRRLTTRGSVPMAALCMAAGAGAALAVMLATGALQGGIAALVPIGSVIIANAMNACAQSAERFRSDVTAHVGEIETALALGADPAASVAPYVRTAVYASLLPRLDMLKSLGLVWIPGVMAGMVASGASPIYAGIYQFVIVAMILAASGIAGMMVTLLMRARAFSAADQLILQRARMI